MAWRVRLSRLTVVALALTFAGAFAFSIRDVPGEAAFLPRGIIVAIVVVAVWNVIAELRHPVADRPDTSVPAIGGATYPGSTGDGSWATPAEPGVAAGDQGTPRAPYLRQGLGVIAASGGLVILAPRLGFYPAAAIFAPVLMFMLGMRRVLRIALASAVLLGTTYAIFTLLLGIRLP